VNLPTTPQGWVNAGTVFHDGTGYTVYEAGRRVQLLVADAITINMLPTARSQQK